MNDNTFEELVICIVAGMMWAVSTIALLCGDGNKGLLDLF